MARLHAFVLLPVVFAASLSPAQNQPAFRATARLVEVTVVALDRRTGPAVNLERRDFQVFDNGKPREIAFVRYEGGPAAETNAGLPPGTFTNRVELTSGPPRNIIALVLDSINTEVPEQMFVKAQAMQLLHALGPQTRVAVFQIGQDFRIIHDFTGDMDSLRERLEDLKVEFPSQDTSNVEQLAREAEELLSSVGRRKYTEAYTQALTRSQTAQIAGAVNYNTMVRGNRVEATLATLESLGRHLSGIPGRKSVIWISNGIAASSANISSGDRRNPNPSVGTNFIAAIRKTSQHLANQGVSLYTIDAKGLTVPGSSLPDVSKNPYEGGTFTEMARADAHGADTRGAFGAMSSITGGRAFFNTNKLAEPVRRVMEDFRGSYSIGFYASGEPDDKWHELRIAVNRPGVSLLHRKGYVFTPDRPQQWGAEELQQALANPLGSSSIHMTAVCAPVSGSEPGSLELKLEIEARDISFREDGGRKYAEAEVTLAEKTAGGSIRFQQENIRASVALKEWEPANQSGLPYRKVWKPGADAVSIRILVRDKTTGQFGTLDVPLARAAR